MLIHNQQAVKPPPFALANLPSSHKPTKDELDNYKVAADSPRFVYIPSIKVPQTRIIHLGLDKTGQIAVPDNVNDTGWYTGSSKPGQPGAMFIFGHISSWQAKGVFYDLDKLKPNDTVTVERGDGKKYTYKVIRTKIYPAAKVNMNEVLAPADSNKTGLNLMTCTGKVIKGTSEFSERLVVFTSLD